MKMFNMTRNFSHSGASAALLAFITLAFGLLMSCGPSVDLKYFDNIELFYSYRVTDDEADKVGKYLVANNFNEGNPISVYLDKTDNTYKVYVSEIYFSEEIIPSDKWAMWERLGKDISKYALNNESVENYLMIEDSFDEFRRSHETSEELAQEALFVPEIGVVASINERESVGLHDLIVNQPFYLQLKVSITAATLAHKTNIPFTIEISNSTISTFSEPQDVRFLVETAPMENIGDKLVYHYSVLADLKPQTGFVVFKVLPNKAGSQTVKFIFGKQVSPMYNRTVSLEYNDDEEDYADVEADIDNEIEADSEEERLNEKNLLYLN